jgi:hypothetical protein
VSDRREGDEMATARFQVVALVRSARVSASGQPDPGTRSRMHQSWAGAREFTGQFMSANNRSVARSAGACLDIESCRAAIDLFPAGVADAVVETSRNETGQWVWRVRLAGQVVATAARSYPRKVRAQLTGNAFWGPAAATAIADTVQVVYR